MPLRSGATLGAYKIIALLGSGGMGDVYRALDTRLGREVALKVLPPAVVTEPGRLERFNREARAIAALNHPHIVTIYSTEEADGVRFLTMELVEGRTLDQLVAGTGLPLARFFEIALPLTDAIAAAHQKQITHRDLKPGNVMLSDQGRVKVLDFGLARIDELVHPDDGLAETIAPITSLGMVVGTMPYMSPEQVEGGEVDHRSDLFSLGVMFYEMLTGTRPFTGASSAALISAILRDPAPDIRARCADVPEGLERLIARCLEKAPDDRVQTARDVFNELRHARVRGEFSGESTAQAGAAAPASMSIAVLPFSARGADKDAEEFGGALTEDVTTGLSMFSGLTVVAPQSARAFHDSPLDVRQIAERLGARFILTGQVRKSGLALRVSAQVVDAHSAALLWTETYDRSLAAADLFAIQDDLTDRIVATVADQGGVLIRSIVRSLRDDKSTSGSASSRLRVRSWDLQHNPTPADHADLRSVLEAAVQTEPGNTDLWATLANSYLVEHSLWFNPLPDSLGRARRAARRAIELDPRNQSGWQWLALACFYQRDRPGLEEALDHAIRINPRNATTLAWMGNILTHAGEYDRGCTLTGRAMEINPGHPGWLHFALFNRSFARGEYLDALSAARRVNIREFMWMHFAIAAAAGRLGRLDEARVAANEMARVAPFLADDATLREFITRWYWPEDLIQGLLEGLSVVRSREIVSADPGRAIASASSSSGGATAASLAPAAGSLRSGIAVVVRPFTSSGSGDTAQTIAEALTADVATGLSRFTYVRLIGGSTANRVGTAPERYAVEGEVRAIGSSIRVTARLVDLASGVHSWADTYSRDLTTDAFALVDDVASRIVATVADGNGALLRAFASTGVDGRDAAIMNLLLRFYGYTQHFTAADHAWLRDALTALTVQEPENARAWAFLGMLAVHEVLFGFNAMPLAAQRAQQLAERALAIDAANQSAWSARALAAFIRRDLMSFRAAADRALDLNPLHSLTTATIGLHFVYIGESERGAALVRRAMSLNPHHPGWYHIALFLEAYRLDNADAALMHAARITMPHIPMSALFAIAAAGRFKRIDDVRAGIDELSRRDAGLLDTGRACTALSLWILDEALLDSLMDGIGKAFALSPR